MPKMRKKDKKTNRPHSYRKAFDIPRIALLYKNNGKYLKECRKGSAAKFLWLDGRFIFLIERFPLAKLQLINSVEVIINTPFEDL